MQSLVRIVCRAGSRGAAARLLELAAAPVAVAHPGAAQPSSAVKHLKQTYGFARPIGVDQSVRVQSRVIPAAASGFGLCAKVLGATRGLSTVGNAAEVASDSDDSPAHQVQEARQDRQTHYECICKLSECYILAGTVLLHYIQ